MPKLDPGRSDAPGLAVTKRIYRHALPTAPLPTHLRHLAKELAYRAKTGSTGCYLSIDALAARLGINRRQVRRNMSELEAAGYIGRQRRGQHPNWYEFRLPAAPRARGGPVAVEPAAQGAPEGPQRPAAAPDAAVYPDPDPRRHESPLDRLQPVLAGVASNASEGAKNPLMHSERITSREGVHAPSRGGFRSPQRGRVRPPERACTPPVTGRELEKTRAWCGECVSPEYRWFVDDEERPIRKCPNCHPGTA